MEESRTSLTIRLSREDKQRLQHEASFSGLSLSEYMRRCFLGGRPIIAQTDIATIKELRRIGGLLKHHFETLKLVGANSEMIQQHRSTLHILYEAIESLGVNSYDRQENKK